MQTIVCELLARLRGLSGKFSNKGVMFFTTDLVTVNGPNLYHSCLIVF